MALEHILLGVLREPGSGYDIKGIFDEAFSHFWAAQHSQIYRTLRRMEEEGLLRSRMQPSERGPDRRVYHITAAGRRHLKEWLAQGPVIGEERFEYLAQIWFLGELHDYEATLDFMRQLRDRLVAERDTLRGIEAEWAASDPRYPDGLDDEDFHSQLVLRMGIEKTTVLADWAERSIERVRARIREGCDEHAV